MTPQGQMIVTIDIYLQNDSQSMRRTASLRVAVRVPVLDIYLPEVWVSLSSL